MIDINAITTGAVVKMETTFTVTKVNKKSVVIKDSNGNTTTVRDRDFKKYGMVSGRVKTTPTKTSKTSKPTSSSPSNRGRYPKWANSTPKKNFVMMERGQGKKATLASYQEYRAFQKQQRS